MENETKKCPHCGAEIMAAAKKCRFCGKWIEEKPQSVTTNYSQDPQIQESSSNKKTLIGGILLAVVLLIIGVSSCTQPSSNKNEEKAEMSKAEIAARQANKEWFAEMDKKENAQMKVVGELTNKLNAWNALLEKDEKGPEWFKSKKTFEKELDEEAKNLGTEGIEHLRSIKGDEELSELKKKVVKETKKLNEIQGDKAEAIDYYKKHDIDKQSANNVSESDSFSWYLKRKQEIKEEKAKLAKQLACTADREKGENIIAQIKALEKEEKELKRKYSK